MFKYNVTSLYIFIKFNLYKLVKLTSVLLLEVTLSFPDLFSLFSKSPFLSSLVLSPSLSLSVSILQNTAYLKAAGAINRTMYRRNRQGGILVFVTKFRLFFPLHWMNWQFTWRKRRGGILVISLKIYLYRRKRRGGILVMSLKIYLYRRNWQIPNFPF